MIALLVIAFIGWLVWITSAVSDSGRAVHELREETAAMRSQLAEFAGLTGGVRLSETAPPAAEAPKQPELQPEPVPAPQLQLQFSVPAEPISVEPADTGAESRAAEAGDITVDSAADESAELAGSETRRERRPAVSLDWERAWQTVAGPLSGQGDGGGDGVGNAEARVGTVWLSRIGVVLLLIGGVFAYRYGVTTDLLRAVIGYAAGIGMLILGFWGQRRHYLIWAQAITGGGLGLLYLTTTAGSALFRPAIIPQPVGFALMALTTALGTGLAVYYGAEVVGLLSLVGGFATPFLLSTGGGGDFRLLFAYIAILDAGLLLVAYFRHWPLYNYLVFLATWGIFGLWRVSLAKPDDWQWAMVAASFFFAIFALVSVAHCLIRRLRSGPADLLLTMINGAVYFGLGLTLIEPLYTVLRGFFAFAVAAVYLGLGALTVRRNRDDRLMVFAFLGLAAVFLTIAFPVALNGSWITAAWALQGAIMVWLGFASGLAGVSQAGLAVLGLAAARLAVWDTFPGRFGMPLLAPGLRAFSFGTVILAFYLAALAYARHCTTPATRDRLAAAGNFFTLWYLAMEVWLRYQGIRPVGEAWGSCGMTVAAVWAVYGLLLALTDFRFDYAGLRHGARVVLGLALAVMATSGALFDVPEIMGYLGLGLTLASIWLAELSFRLRGADPQVNGSLSLVASVVAFAALGLQVNRVLDARFVLPIGQPLTAAILATQTSTRLFVIIAALAGYALLSMIAGMVLRSASARGLACLFSTLLAVATGYAAMHLETPWQMRAITFALVIPGAYLIAWLSSRAGAARPVLERRIAALAGLAAATLTAWWGATEILRSLSGHPHWFDGPRFNLVLIWLGGYALAVGAVGLWLRSRAVRSLASGIQWLSLILLLVASASFATPWATHIGAAVTIITGIYATNWLFRAGSTDRREARSRLFLGLAACVATLVWAGCAINRLFPAGYPEPTDVRLAMSSARNHWFLVAAGVYALAVLVVGLALRSRATRAVGLALQGLTIAGLLTIGLSNLTAGLALRLAAYAACIGGAYASTLIAHRSAQRTEVPERRATEWLSLAATGLTVVWLAFQVNRYFAPFVAGGTAAERAVAVSALNFGISASWGVYGLLVLVAGFALRHRWTRLLGLLTLTLTLGKIGLLDMWQLAVHWRIWITVGLGVIFVTASLMYQRFVRIILGDDHHGGPTTSGRSGLTTSGRSGVDV